MSIRAHIAPEQRRCRKAGALLQNGEELSQQLPRLGAMLGKGQERGFRHCVGEIGTLK